MQAHQEVTGAQRSQRSEVEVVPREEEGHLVKVAREAASRA